MAYSVIANGNGWGVVRNGMVEANFSTKEAALKYAESVSEAGDQGVKIVEGGDKSETTPD